MRLSELNTLHKTLLQWGFHPTFHSRWKAPWMLGRQRSWLFFLAVAVGSNSITQPVGAGVAGSRRKAGLCQGLRMGAGVALLCWLWLYFSPASTRQDKKLDIIFIYSIFKKLQISVQDITWDFWCVCLTQMYDSEADFCPPDVWAHRKQTLSGDGCLFI